MTVTERVPDGVPITDPEAVVRAFLSRLEALDVDGVLELVDPAIVYHNKGFPPARGVQQFGKQMRALERYASGFEARIHNIAANGGVVLTERTDVIELGRFRPHFWVCGTFEVRDGRIVLWRDYFDFVDVTVAMVRAAVRMVFR
jgi:limonene-1,2-epoxide hydrolase